MLPLASGDSDLVLDLDFTKGQAAINAALVTANGFAHSGAAGTWDSTLGWNPNGTETYLNTNWTPAGLGSRAPLYPNFTIYVEVRRSDLGITYLDDNTGFIDNAVGPSVNAPYPANTYGYLFYITRSTAPTPHLTMRYKNFGTLGAGGQRVEIEHCDTAVEGGMTLRYHPDQITTPDYADGDFAKIMFVVEGQTIWYYFDGEPMYYWTRTSNTTTDDMFQMFGIACNQGGTGVFRGYIRRMQVIKRAINNRAALGTKLAVQGDSFVVNGGSIANPGALTVAGVNAMQNGLNDSALATKTTTINPLETAVNTPWIWALRKLCANTGLRCRWYIAGQGAHGYSSTVASGTTQFAACMSDAVIAYDPEIILMLGSVNDINIAGAPDTSLAADLTAAFDKYINGCKKLRKILFTTTFPSRQAGGASADQPAYGAELARIVGIQKSFDGYRGKVQVIDVYTLMGSWSNTDRGLSRGGHPCAPLWDAAYTKTETNGDIHPGQYGQNRMAEVLWPYFKAAVLTTPQ